jgi:hypothetical protein
MKISKNTIDILKNFSTINPSIVFRKGNRINVVSPSDTIMAYAFVDEEFPRDFAIHDVITLINLLSLDEESEIDFHDNYLSIDQKNKSQIKYYYSDPRLINTIETEDKLELPSRDIQFDLESSVLINTTKAMRILSLDHIGVFGEDGKILIKAIKENSSTDNVYEVEVGECDIDFKAIFEEEKLLLLPMDYRVTLSKEYGSLFENETLTYCVALHESSSF